MVTEHAEKTETLGKVEAEVVAPALPETPEAAPAEAPATGEAAKKPTYEELEAALTAKDVALAKSEHDKTLATKAQAALDKKLAERKQQAPTDFDLSETLAKQVDDFRGDGLTTSQDAVKAHRQKAVAAAGQAEVLASQEVMRDALTEAGISVENWNDVNLPDALLGDQVLWNAAMQQFNFKAANRIAAKVKAYKTAAKPEVKPEPTPRKSAAQRSAELGLNGDVPDGGSTGAAATAENIDSLYLAWESRNPGKRGNPYAERYRTLGNTGSLD